MVLEDIGFYTLNDARAKSVTFSSPLQRCELIVTNRCNFKCPYCRGIKKEFQGDLTLEQAKEVVDIWTDAGLKNIRFSGGEPTIWPHLVELVAYTKNRPSISHIAISSNGSAPMELYHALVDAGVNDFSFSLDACCSKTADAMAGTDSRFQNIVRAVTEMSARTYCTVGIVVDSPNLGELQSTINYAKSLGVHDIRVIPSAQWNHRVDYITPPDMPILQYRINRIHNGDHVRGIGKHDCTKCHLVKDDMVVLHGKHFPCVIYMREQGNAIGDVYGRTQKDIAKERESWYNSHDSGTDPICSKNCLDFCIEHNNRVEDFQGGMV